MHNALPLSLAVLVSVGIIVIGCFYGSGANSVSAVMGD
jgi:hypothetical protein